MQVLLSVCRTRDEMALQDVHDQGAIPILIGTVPLITAHLSVSQCEPLCAGILRECVGELGREREREKAEREGGRARGWPSSQAYCWSCSQTHSSPSPASVRLASTGR